MAVDYHDFINFCSYSLYSSMVLYAFKASLVILLQYL